jgi:hypothetical protein
MRCAITPSLPVRRGAGGSRTRQAELLILCARIGFNP